MRIEGGGVEERARPPSFPPTFHGSLGFRLHKLFLFDKASTISCSRGRLGGEARAPPPHPFLQTMVSLTVFTDHEFKPETTIASGRGVCGARSTPPPHTEAPRRFPSTVGFLWAWGGWRVGSRRRDIHSRKPPHKEFPVGGGVPRTTRLDVAGPQKT